MAEIIPAILATTEQQYKEDLQKLTDSESFSDGWVHIDFMDNKFVPNLGITPEITVAYETSLKKEAHLMVEHPLDWLQKLKDASFERVIFHFESKDDPTAVIEKAKELELEVGIAVNQETAIEKIVPFKDTIELVLIMGIIPGFQGQPFIPETINRIKETLRLRSANNFLIGVDGAVNDTNVKQLVDEGVEHLVVGSYLLKGDIDENVEKIWEILKG